jgi:hypothetical protein
MNSHIEEEELLRIGSKVIDVSNVSVGRSMEGLKRYNIAVQKVYDEKLDSIEFNYEVDKIGLYLIQHDYEALRLRFNIVDSIKQVIKRSLIKTKDFRRFSKEEYKDFHGWIYFTITGKKKESLEAEKDMMEIATEFYLDMGKQGISQEKCLELLPTLIQDLAKQLKPSTTDREES